MCLKSETWEFPGGLLVRIPGFHYHGLGSISGQGTEILTKEREKDCWDCWELGLVASTGTGSVMSETAGGRALV